MNSTQKRALIRLRLEEIFLHCEVDDRRTIRRCAIAALMLLLAIYPDVIFRGASVSAANFLNITQEPRPERVQILPERSGREAYHTYFDIGGASLQSEPNAQFMKRAFWNGESVFWNPYSATGSYGIETLVDIKTSPISIIVALFGGSDTVFHLAFLGFSYLGTLCLLVLITTQWRLSLLAALAAAVTYLLNGYNVSNLASNVSQTWHYFPVLLLALVSFARQPRVLSFLGIAAGSLMMLSTTFLPTTLIILFTTMFVGAASAIGCANNKADQLRSQALLSARLIGFQVAGALLGLLILAAIYLPILEALRYEATGEYYAARKFTPATLFNLISFFTPKHAFEIYNAITERALSLRGNAAFHQGIVSALIASQAIRVWPMFQRTVVIALMTILLLCLGRVYDAPLISTAINSLPVIGNIGQQYIWFAISASLTLLVPFGIHGLINTGVRLRPLLFLALVILFALVYTSYVYGVTDLISWFYIGVAGLMVTIAVLVILAVSRSPAAIAPAILLVLLSFAELTFYVNHYRLSRTDRFSEPPRFVRYLQLNTGLHRVASYGYWGIPPEYGSAYGIAQIGSMTFHLFKRYEALFNRLILPNPKERWFTFVTLARAPDTDTLNLPAFDMLGVKFLTIPATFARLRNFMDKTKWVRTYEDRLFIIYQNPDPLPRSYVTYRLVEGGTTPLDFNESPLALTVSDDRQLIAAANKLGITRESAAPIDAVGFSAITRYEHDRVEIVADLVRPGILVLNDAWHTNWHARVNGQPHYIGVVNEAFRGIALPAGRHVIEMSYAPRTLLAGKILTAIGLLIAFVLFAARSRIDPLLARTFAPVPSASSDTKV